MMTKEKAIDILRHYTNLGYGIVIEGDTNEITEALKLVCEESQERVIAQVTLDSDKLKEIADDIVEQIRNGEIVLKADTIEEGKCPNSGDCPLRPKDEWINVNDLRLMRVDECIGHTVEYAQGWKACIEWLKSGGDRKEFQQ